MSNDSYVNKDATLRPFKTTDSLQQAPNMDVQPLLFLQNMINQVQLLACLKWLGECQVLTLIPLRDSVPAMEVADLAGVSRAQLSRAVRMLATAGFLHEPRPGHIAHTSLSAPFVTSFSLLDAAMFLAESAAPTAFRMNATARDSSDGSAFSAALNPSQSFMAACVAQPRLQRQWNAYRQCTGEGTEPFVEVLKRLNWRSMGSVVVVDIAAKSADDARALSHLYPCIHFIVQLQEPNTRTSNSTTSSHDVQGSSMNGNITIQTRATAVKQQVRDASVYILRPNVLGSALKAQLLGELNSHLSILRANPSASMVLAPPLLPEPGSVHLQIEIRARLRDLHRLQLTNESDMELSELVEIVHEIRDSAGGLVVVNKILYSNGMVAGINIKYKANI